jgi:adenine deaminase
MTNIVDIKEKILSGTGQIKADVVMEHCRILNVNTKEIIHSDIAIRSGYITGIGDVSELKDANTHIIDINNRYVSPGLIDGHVHFESSMVTLTQFAAAALKHGTTGVVIDPHEIANVLGKKGIELVINEARDLPLNIFITISSCVPSTPFETSGASLDLSGIESLMDNEMVVGLGEVMNVPGVLSADEKILAMIQAALERKLVVDGHCPRLTGRELWGYMCAGATSDHESIEYEEALEKLRLGMTLMLREGSAAKSLDRFIPGLIKDGISLENVCFVTDDKHPADLSKGYMDTIIKKAIALGVEPLDAVSMCTINTARHYRIDHLVGSISIGRKADFVVLNDMDTFKIDSVFTSGVQIKALRPVVNYPDFVFDTIRYKDISIADMRIIDEPDKTVNANIIKVFPDMIFTEKITSELETDSTGAIMPDINNDILSTAVIERHGINGNIGHGFVKGFSLQSGAIAQSIGHDSHNVVVTGTDFSDMALAANVLKELKGGIVLVRDGTVLDSMALPYAGLLSIEPVEEAAGKLKKLDGIINDMGCTLASAFITHSFIALPVIPRLRLTDMGLFDVEKFKVIDVVDKK